MGRKLLFCVSAANLSLPNYLSVSAFCQAKARNHKWAHSNTASGCNSDFLSLVIPIICHEAFKALKNLQHGANYHKHDSKTLISLRSDDSFKLYWQKVSREAEELKAISKPKRPRKRRVPKRLDDGTAPWRSSANRRRSLQKYLFPNLRCGDKLY